jgi:O-antigen/teichoic acid export membrane protein
VGRLTSAASAILVWRLGIEPAGPALAIALLVGELVALVGIALVLHVEPRSVAFAPAEPTTVLLRRALPLACNGFFNLIYNRLDVALVLLLAGSAEAGLYAPASRIQDGLYLLPASAVAALLPLASRRFATGEGEVRRLLLVSIGLSLAVTLPAVGVVLLLARPLVEVLLGGEYAAAVAPVRILALSVPFIALSTPVVSTLLATDRAPATTAMFATGLVVSLTGLAILTPAGGAVGAAWASLLREPAISLVGTWLVLRRQPARRLLPAPVAAGAP